MRPAGRRRGCSRIASASSTRRCRSSTSPATSCCRSTPTSTLSRIRALLAALEPGEDEAPKPQDHRGQAVLEVDVGGACLVPREERRQRAGVVDPVNGSDEQKKNPERDGREDQ